MARVHVLDGLGMDAAVRALQRQVVLFYPSRTDRDADLREPWVGAVTNVPNGDGTHTVETWNGSAWVAIGGGSGGGGGSGVTDHGALSGLADDDHPQYLRPTEVVAGPGIGVSVPGDGSVVVSNTNPVGIDQATADARYVNVAGDTMAGALVLPALPTGQTDAANKAYVDGQDIAHASATDPHQGYLRPVEVVAGSDIEVDLASVPGSVVVSSLVVPGIDQATADARYVNTTGDTMTGALTLPAAMPTQAQQATHKAYVDTVVTGGVVNPNFLELTATRVHVKDPAPNDAAGWSNLRMYHDNNTDHMALSVGPQLTPGLELFDSRDPNTVMMRAARGERVKFPAKGHEHKYHVCVAIAGATPVTAWTQMPLGTVYETSGNITVQANPGGIYLPEAGYYQCNGFVLCDRTLANLTVTIKWGAYNVALYFQNWSPITNRTHVACTFYAASPDWLTFNAQTNTPCWLGGQGGEDKLTLVSLF